MLSARLNLAVTQPWPGVGFSAPGGSLPGYSGFYKIMTGSGSFCLVFGSCISWLLYEGCALFAPKSFLDSFLTKLNEFCGVLLLLLLFVFFFFKLFLKEWNLSSQ